MGRHVLKCVLSSIKMPQMLSIHVAVCRVRQSIGSLRRPAKVSLLTSLRLEKQIECRQRDVR